MDVIQRTEVNIPSKKVKTTHNPSMDYVELTEKDLKALVKKASTRFTSLCKDQTTDNQIISTQPVHKVLDLTVNACAPVEPTAVFFAPSQYGIVNIDITTADSKSCESTSVYISKNVLASKMDDYQTSLEKKADLMDELLTTTTSDLKKLHQVEKKDTAGKGWFDLPAPKLTKEMKLDLLLIRNRNTLSHTSFQRSQLNESLPKYFQMGTMIEGVTGFLNDRIAKKDRRQTIAEQYLSDPEFVQYMKKTTNALDAAKPVKVGRKKYGKKKRV